MKYFFETISSKAYWQYIFLTRAGVESILAIFGTLYLFVEALNFFRIYTRNEYASYAFIILLLVSIILSILFRHPIKSISIKFPKKDITIEVKIADLFKFNGATVISTNTDFEADVAGGKIDINSLQGQFTARYFAGNQKELIDKINKELNKIKKSNNTYEMGTTIPINTHGRTFYFTAMSQLNEKGNARSTLKNIGDALNGIWNYVREEGDLQELVLPVLGTGRGRLNISRKKVIAYIAESFVEASEHNKFADKLIIVISPEDATDFAVNLYDIKDHLNQVLHS